MAIRRKKILFIVPSLRAGGSERVILYLVNNLNREKFDINLALVKKEGQFLDLLANDIKVIDLKSKRVRYALFKIIKLIKEEKPDIVFSTLGYLNLLLAMIRNLFPGTKFIARESSIPSIQIKHEKYPLLFSFLYSGLYKNFNLIVCQSKFMKLDLVENFKIPENKIKVIYNPVDVDKIRKLSRTNEILFDDKYKNLIFVGMLRPEKGVDLLLKAFSMLDDKYRLYIIGDGKEKRKLVRLAKNLNIGDRVYFLGFQKNPYKYMAQADLMVLPSRYEGFPNVVLEANALGLPVVAFDCPGGIREIIKDGVNGFLIEYGNVERFVIKIEKAINYEWDVDRMKFMIKKRFDFKNIIQEYEYLLYKT